MLLLPTREDDWCVPRMIYVQARMDIGGTVAGHMIADGTVAGHMLCSEHIASLPAKAIDGRALLACVAASPCPDVLKVLIPKLAGGSGGVLAVMVDAEQKHEIRMRSLDGGKLYVCFKKECANLRQKPQAFARLVEAFGAPAESDRWEHPILEQLALALGYSGLSDPGAKHIEDLLGEVKDGAFVFSLEGSILAAAAELRDIPEQGLALALKKVNGLHAGCRHAAAVATAQCNATRSIRGAVLIRSDAGDVHLLEQSPGRRLLAHHIAKHVVQELGLGSVRLGRLAGCRNHDHHQRVRSAFPPGTKLELDGAEWVVVKELGAGGQGVVLRVQDNGNSSQVAKVVCAERAHELREEADAYEKCSTVQYDSAKGRPGRLRHYEESRYVSLQGGLFWALFMPECSSTLRSELQSGMYKSNASLAKIRIQQLVQEVNCRHRFERVAIQDLKPENIGITRDDRLVLLDIGATQSHQVVVYTQQYAAPEVLAGRRDATFAADMFALGLIILEILGAELPARCRSTEHEWYRKVQRSLNEVKHRLSLANKFARQCLQLDPSERPECQNQITKSWLRVAALEQCPHANELTHPVKRWPTLAPSAPVPATTRSARRVRWQHVLLVRCRKRPSLPHGSWLVEEVEILRKARSKHWQKVSFMQRLGPKAKWPSKKALRLKRTAERLQKQSVHE